MRRRGLFCWSAQWSLGLLLLQIVSGIGVGTGAGRRNRCQRIGIDRRFGALGEFRVSMQQGRLSGYFSAQGRFGRGEDDARIAVGLGFQL